MIRALPLIDADPFFCVNSDNIWLDGPRNAFGALSDAWDPEKMDALLLLVNHARAFNFRGRAISISIRKGGSRAAGRPDRAVHLHRLATACCAMRPRDRFPPACCGTVPLPKGGFMACRIPGCGTRWASRR
jgi:hypothetical protein